jgi:hypothetical protein
MDAKQWKEFLLGVYLLVTPVILAFLILALWQSSNETIGNVWEKIAPLHMFGKESMVHHEFRLVLLVILTGALGSCVHATTSFVTYKGNKRFESSWCWWYVLRPFIGMALALIFYFVIRGGILLLTSETQTGKINEYGIAAVSGIVGLFSKNAIDKLRELFDTMFKMGAGGGDEERKDKLNT